MKRLAIVLSILAAVAFATMAMATVTIHGKYSTTILAPPEAAGHWTMSFKKNGTGTTAFQGVLIPNTFTFKGSVLTSPGGGANICPTVGTYRIHRHDHGKRLTFTVIHDPCTVGRKLIIPGHVWTKGS
jgi:hypothetical protein